MFETSRLYIRLMEGRDIEFVRRLHNEESTLNKLTDPFHVSQEEQELWFNSLSKSRKSRRYILIEKESDEICGIIRIDDLDLTNRSATVGADVDLRFRRQGLASEAYERIINYLFNDLGLHRLQLVTLITNDIALKLYQKLGFQQEGVIRESIYRNGEFNDLILMGLLQSEWLKTKVTE